ncbi:Stk1 family PASTA domain-containing Ser/Thr kinase [Eshraghiella crossota]|uniref:Stk1 family PASTA domain-containing Ser/Thr kinase n=1 Tax=Eshraghiella crossota TaxID=45851 RepID=UPI003FD6D9A6
MLRKGMFIAERYEILERIGSGGMSDVYKAKCHKLNRYVAIKVLKPEYSEDKTFVSKFKAEAQAAAGLMHANIVNVYDVGEENGIYYIVMELVEGITLKKYIEKKGVLGVREAVSIAIQVAQGIDAAHKHNIVHRDIKPQNIIISKEGKVKVTDFGIARAASSNTINSSVMGSVHYISPEQARGGYSDEKSDIYSFGITLYEMLTGRVPFEGDTTVAIALQHIQDEIVSPRQYVPEIPVSVEKIVLKCTQKRTERRYQNMTDLIADLKRSLVTPDEDFVTIGAPLASDAPTKLITPDEVNEIAEKSSAVKVEDIEATPIGEVNKKNSLGEAAEEDDIDEDGDDDNLDDIDGDDEELDEDEAGNKKTIDKVITILAISVAVAIVVILVILITKIAKNFGSGSSGKKNEPTSSIEDTSDKVKVPDVLGMTLEEAKKALNDEKLGFKYEYGYSKEDDVDKVYDTNPEIGSFVDKNTTITVYISKGVKKVEMVDVIGKTQNEAEEAIIKAELKYTFQYIETTDDSLIGKVESTDPVAGTTVNEGTQVTVVLYKGKNEVNIKMPDLSDKSEADAKKELEDLGFDINNVSVERAYDNEVEEGYVITQNGPKVGEETPSTAKIGLVVSLGKPIIPDIVGKTKSEAEELLDKYSLKLGKVTEKHDDKVEAGKIISINGYSVNDSVNIGTAIDVVISLGVEQTPAPTEPSTTPVVVPSVTQTINLDAIANKINSDCDEKAAVELIFSVHYTNNDGNKASVEAGTPAKYNNISEVTGSYLFTTQIKDAKAGDAYIVVTIKYTKADGNSATATSDNIPVVIG